MPLIQPPVEELPISARILMLPQTTFGRMPTQSVRPVEVSGINFSDFLLAARNIKSKFSPSKNIDSPQQNPSAIYKKVTGHWRILFHQQSAIVKLKKKTKELRLLSIRWTMKLTAVSQRILMASYIIYLHTETSSTTESKNFYIYLKELILAIQPYTVIMLTCDFNASIAKDSFETISKIVDPICLYENTNDS